MHALALQFAASLAHEAFQITHGPAEGVLRAAPRTGPSIGPGAITVGDVLPPFAFRLPPSAFRALLAGAWSGFDTAVRTAFLTQLSGLSPSSSFSSLR
jgi:hypothetical protein